MKEVIFYGDDVLIYDFPDDVEIVYPEFDDEAEKNGRGERGESEREIVRKAIEDAKFEDVVEGKRRIVVAFDDVSVPFPLPKNDPRRIMASEVVERLGKDAEVTFICATGMHRKCSDGEIKQMLGNIAARYRVVNHDCYDVKRVGETESGYVVEVNRIAAEADLVIYLSTPFLPMNGGWKSIAVGLGSYECIRQHHLPRILSEGSYMNPQSKMHEIIEEVGRFFAENVEVFQIEAVVDNRFYSGFLSSMWKSIRGKDSISKRMMLAATNAMPESVKAKFRRGYRAGYRIISARAGEVESVHRESLKVIEKVRGVKMRRYDALIFGVPNMTPYSVNSEMNPILFHTLVRGYLCNMFQRALKKGGQVAALNPVREVFDDRQHAAYRYLFHRLKKSGILMNSSIHEAIDDLERIEREIVERRELIEAYKRGAYHPAHAVIALYWGALGFDFDCIAVAASDSAEVLGFGVIKSLDDAIRELRETSGRIAFVSLPPIFYAI